MLHTSDIDFPYLWAGAYLWGRGSMPPPLKFKYSRESEENWQNMRIIFKLFGILIKRKKGGMVGGGGAKNTPPPPPPTWFLNTPLQLEVPGEGSLPSISHLIQCEDAINKTVRRIYFQYHKKIQGEPKNTSYSYSKLLMKTNRYLYL